MNITSEEVNPVLNGETIRVSGALTLKDVRQIGRLSLPLRKRLTVYAIWIGGLLGFVAALGLPPPFGPILFLSLLGCSLYMYSRIGRRGYREGRGLYGVTNYEFHAEGVRIISGDVDTRLKWNAFDKVLSNQKLFVLYLPHHAGRLAIVRSWCETEKEWTRLCDFIRDHTPGLFDDRQTK